MTGRFSRWLKQRRKPSSSKAILDNVSYYVPVFTLPYNPHIIFEPPAELHEL